MNEQQALNVRCALRTILDDLQATYDCLADGKMPVVSIGQFRRLSHARAILKKANAS
jgi:ABC-type transport system involved in cytochrome bd biosynthesis fused ATPase/permease subunit